MDDFTSIGQVMDTCRQIADGEIIKDVKILKADMGNGVIVLEPILSEGLYYKVIEELMGASVTNDSQLFMLLKEYAKAKKAYDNLKSALDQVATACPKWCSKNRKFLNREANTA